MSNTTFSGPVRSGTQRDGTPAAPGTSVVGAFNLGRTVLAQSFTITTAMMLSAGTNRVAFNLPAGSKIVDLEVEILVALTTATNLGVQVGIAATPGLFYASFNTGTAIGKVAQATVDAGAQVVACNNIGTADVPVVITTTAATGNAAAGSAVVTIYYIQRNADGS